MWDFEEEQEESAPVIDPFFYHVVGDHQKNLSRHEQESLLKKIDVLKVDFIECVLFIPHVRYSLIAEWWRRYSQAQANYRASSTAKLAIDYNSSKRGWNKKVSQRLDHYMSEARRELAAGYWRSAIKSIKKARVHPKLFFTAQMRRIVTANSEIPEAREALAILNEIEGYRLQLLYSVMKLASDAAKRGIKLLSGEVVSYNDILQIALIAAYEATLAGWDSSVGARWSSYVYEKCKNVITKFIAEHTRTISLPRTVLERYKPIREAREKLGEEMGYAELAAEANKQLKGNFYTPEEVESLVVAVQYTNMPYGVEEEEITDESADTAYTSEVTLLQTGVWSRLKTLLSEEEWRVLQLRFGYGNQPPLGRDATAEQYKQTTGLKMNKERIREIEEVAMGKLRKANDIALREMWLTSEEMVAERRGDNE